VTLHALLSIQASGWPDSGVKLDPPIVCTRSLCGTGRRRLAIGPDDCALVTKGEPSESREYRTEQIVSGAFLFVRSGRKTYIDRLVDTSGK